MVFSRLFIMTMQKQLLISIKDHIINYSIPINQNDTSKNFNVNNGDIVKVETNSDGRKLIFDDVVIRVRDDYALAMHIDTDESNACVGAKEAKIIT